jgi:hypothetical protein
VHIVLTAVMLSISALAPPLGVYIYICGIRTWMGIFCLTSCILIMQMTNRVTSVASPYLPHALTSSADPCYAHGDNHPSQHAQYGPQTMPHQGPENEDLGNPALVPNYQQASSPQGYIMVGQSPGQSMQYTSLFYGSGAFCFLFAVHTALDHHHML